MRRRPHPPAHKRVISGLMLTFLLHVTFICILLFLPIKQLLLFLGLAQFLYMVPAWLWARDSGATGTQTGLVIGAAITVMLNVVLGAMVHSVARDLNLEFI